MLRRPSHATVVAYLALFVAVGTGGAYASHLVVDGSDVVDESLTGADLKNLEVKTPDLATGSVTSAKVLDRSLTSTDVAFDGLTGTNIDESTLSKVLYAERAGVAAQGGVGRYGFRGSCDPESETFINCSEVALTLRDPGRVHLVGTVSYHAEDGASVALGSCRLEVDSFPIGASEQGFRRKNSQYSDHNQATLIAVTDVLSSGPHVVGVECRQNQSAGAISYPSARIVAVALSDG